MIIYKNRNQKINTESTTVLFLQTNKDMNPKYWEVCRENEIKGDYLGTESYTENGVKIIVKTWGRL